MTDLCRNGHPLTPENLYLKTQRRRTWKEGVQVRENRVCRVCERIRYQKRKEAGHMKFKVEKFKVEVVSERREKVKIPITLPKLKFMEIPLDDL